MKYRRNIRSWKSSTCNNHTALQNKLLRPKYIRGHRQLLFSEWKGGRAGNRESRLCPQKEHHTRDLIMTFSVYPLLQHHGNWEPQNIKERSLKKNLGSFWGAGQKTQASQMRNIKHSPGLAISKGRTANESKRAGSLC